MKVSDDWRLTLPQENRKQDLPPPESTLKHQEPKDLQGTTGEPQGRAWAGVRKEFGLKQAKRFQTR